MNNDDGDDENVPCASVSIDMVPSKEMDHTFTEPQNTSDNENEFEIPPIMSTPLPPEEDVRQGEALIKTIQTLSSINH